MKQLKSIEVFTDVRCKHCVFFSESRCCKSLPAIPVEPESKCSQGEWLFKGNRINFQKMCLKLATFRCVTDVDDILCRNCVYYDSSGRECHFHRECVYNTGSDDWCDNGMWPYQENDGEVILASFSFFYPND
jgi:hypothetical protein